jgi:AraC family transcriptional regulator, melibiose operon regulatory protein
MPNHADMQTFGLASWCGTHEGMERSHRHNEIELNFIEHGAMTYFVAGEEITVPANRFALFWAAIPHQVVRWEAPTFFYWVTLPLGYFLQWSLPGTLRQSILNGALIIDPVERCDPKLDLCAFRQWYADLNGEIAEQKMIALLEIEARLRRLALQNTGMPAPHTDNREPRFRAAAEMARYIGEHSAEPLSVPQIAKEVGLHPNYAMTLFRATFGVSIVEYITQHRISHAQRLLITTEHSVLDIAMETGFGSTSQFYAAFQRLCGLSPGRYRASLQQFAHADAP